MKPFNGVWEAISSEEFDEILNNPSVQPSDAGWVLNARGQRTKTRFSEFSDGKKNAIRLELKPNGQRKLMKLTRIYTGD